MSQGRTCCKGGAAPLLGNASSRASPSSYCVLLQRYVCVCVALVGLVELRPDHLLLEVGVAPVSARLLLS